MAVYFFFMKTVYYVKQRKEGEERHPLAFLPVSMTSSLVEHSWILLSASHI